MLFSLLSFFNSFFLFSHISNSSSFPPPLSKKEEEYWLSILQNGTDKEKEEAKSILVERNLRLVAHIVKKYPNYKKDSEDLISIGTIGLIKAVTSFKLGKNTKLATYAARCIENAMVT